MKIYPKNLHSLKKKTNWFILIIRKKIETDVSCSWMSASIKRVTHIKKNNIQKHSVLFSQNVIRLFCMFVFIKICKKKEKLTRARHEHLDKMTITEHQINWYSREI